MEGEGVNGCGAGRLVIDQKMKGVKVGGLFWRETEIKPKVPPKIVFLPRNQFLVHRIHLLIGKSGVFPLFFRKREIARQFAIFKINSLP